MKIQNYWRNKKFRVYKNNKFYYFSLGFLRIVANTKTIIDDVTYQDMENAEQYTGLKDKNGKEIYEGDIVKFAEYKTEIIGAVTYENGQFNPIAYINDCCNGLDGSSTDFEIIGNIYEHPELLETK